MSYKVSDTIEFYRLHMAVPFIAQRCIYLNLKFAYSIKPPLTSIIIFTVLKESNIILKNNNGNTNSEAKIIWNYVSLILEDIDQLNRILSLVGTPSDELLEKISSKEVTTCNISQFLSL